MVTGDINHIHTISIGKKCYLNLVIFFLSKIKVSQTFFTKCIYIYLIFVSLIIDVIVIVC